jgi:transposase
VHRSWYDRKRRRLRDLSCAGQRIYLDLEVRRVNSRRCGAVKRERLDFPLENALHTKRFALYVGRSCRRSTTRNFAAELHLDWQTVKRLEMDYMREQIRRVGTPGPKAIGIDEISIRKGHSYRIVVSDLQRRRPIWFGGDDRSEASMDQFYRFLGKNKAKRIRLAVMDMWKPFRNSTHQNAPQAAVLLDKFHVMKHLGEALHKIRKAEYARLEGKQRRFIKGQKYTLLSHPQNLTGTAKKNLKLLLAANKRLNTAYLLKESFGQLRDYNHDAWAQKFFENWRASLNRQHLKPSENCAQMIERHWDSIAAYCQPENKAALGFVERLNNKIRVIQRRTYGLRDEEYLRLKLLTSMLHQI